MKKTVPIEATAALMCDYASDYYYIRHIFNALREHKELLASADYKRLYDEAIDYLFRHAVECCGWNKDEATQGYDAIEFLADLDNSHANKYTEKYSVATVDSFLAQRRKIWS